jgi:long-chain acyl-CoA synthetase
LVRDTTVDRVFHHAAVRGPKPALVRRLRGNWVSINYEQFGGACRDFAGGLLALGYEPGRAVAILGNNTPEWVIADIGAMAAQAVPAGVYPTLNAEQAAYVVGHSEARVLVAENAEQWKKIEAQRHTLPLLQKVVLMRDAESITDPLVTSFEEFCTTGRPLRKEVHERFDGIREGGVATLIYTSGTTGPPKGAMLTHTNLSYMARTACGIRGRCDQESIVSYLPLSHIAEQMFTIHVPAISGGTVTFAEAMDKMRDALLVARPTIFLGVPRVWEKFKAALEGRFATTKGAKGQLIAWARKVGLEAGQRLIAGEALSPALAAQYKLAHKLFYSTLRAQLGLDKLEMAVTGAAPVSREVLEFFLSCGIPVHEVYGQTEGGGATTFNMPQRMRLGTVGQAIPGAEVRIAEDGEILLRSPGVFHGYLKDEAATAATKEGEWLKTGDIGELEPSGHLRITDRKKDLIITSGGKNVAPQNIEKLLKGIDGIGQAVVIGDRRSYLTALLTIDVDRVKALAEAKGWPTDPALLAGHAGFRAHVEAGIAQVNQQLARYETIKRHTLLARDFTLESGELTPTQKVKRNVVTKNYASAIEAMYAEAVQAQAS